MVISRRIARANSIDHFRQRAGHTSVKAKRYLDIVAHYESCLEKHGDNHLGVDWPNATDAEKRYRVMLEVIRPGAEVPVALLDFGCGASHLYEYIARNDVKNLVYSGLDISPKFISLSRRKFPANEYHCVDILAADTRLPSYDYIVMNGVFTEKRELPFDEMLAYFKSLVEEAFKRANRGVAFNVMSKQVDWEREDLFHLPLDTLADFVTKRLTRNFIIRNDYGLYEYTVYLYK
jgi:SAM-dependent methyltransferase